MPTVYTDPFGLAANYTVLGGNQDPGGMKGGDGNDEWPGMPPGWHPPMEVPDDDPDPDGNGGPSVPEVHEPPDPELIEQARLLIATQNMMALYAYHMDWNDFLRALWGDTWYMIENQLEGWWEAYQKFLDALEAYNQRMHEKRLAEDRGGRIVGPGEPPKKRKKTRYGRPGHSEWIGEGVPTVTGTVAGVRVRKGWPGPKQLPGKNWLASQLYRHGFDGLHHVVRWFGKWVALPLAALDLSTIVSDTPPPGYYDGLYDEDALWQHMMEDLRKDLPEPPADPPAETGD